ncbi:hypothetical protein GGR60_002716 [Xanthomonas arboricola]|uniref:hypothetical protein n=1 Tax=Xanthomonas euroxanthea TaxID=2259622 RepID=UPI001430CEA3|nr:hypothetical protein [Xanthomonas euroxanthea]NJC38162.1 hypothetical protein [Xanthomonas euroxanthea]
MSRHITPLDDSLGAGELGALVGLPIYNNGDIAELCLTADDWAALTERRRRVGWPLNGSRFSMSPSLRAAGAVGVPAYCGEGGTYA